MQSFYQAEAASGLASSLWPKKGAPPIYSSLGRRSEEALARDRRIRDAASFSELLHALQEGLPDFDEGSLVIAFCVGAKLVDERSLASVASLPVWASLQQRLRDATHRLEPRGLSMVAYACAKMAWREEAFLRDVAAASTKKAPDFGSTDIAKICWAYAKLDFVAEASELWAAMGQVLQKVHLSRHVDLSMIAWAFSTARQGDAALYAELASASLDLMQDLTPQCLANVAMALARENIAHPELFDAICRRGLGLVRHFADFDATNLCWALARLQWVDYELFELLADHTVGNGFVKRYSAEMAAQMAWAFAVAGFAHGPLFADLADFVARHASVFEAQYLSTCAWAFATLNFRHDSVWHALAREVKGGRLWRYRPDQLCIIWAFTKVRWDDPELLRDMMQVSSQRLTEFDTQGIINFLSAVVVMSEEGSEAHSEDALRLVDSIMLELMQKELDPEELEAACRWACRAGRLEPACQLRRPGSEALGVILAEERSGEMTEYWQRLAEMAPHELAASPPEVQRLLSPPPRLLLVVGSMLPAPDLAATTIFLTKSAAAAAALRDRGFAAELRAEVLQRGAHAVDAVYLQGGGEAALEDLKKLEELQLLCPGCRVVADCALLPGAPGLLWRMQRNLELIEVQEPGFPPRENWWAFWRWSESSPPAASPQLARLVAESESLRKPRSTRAALLEKRFAERLRGFVRSFGEGGLPAPISEAALEPPPSSPSLQPRDAVEGMAEAPDLRNMSFEDWLAALDTSGAALCYVSAAEQCYDTVAQIAQTYTLVDKTSNEKSLDPLLFSDLEISEAHRPLFTRWFVNVCGVKG